MNELVSIMIATHNRRKMLEKALTSAKNQTYKNLEIIVGDNCSTDDTEEYMLEQAKIDSRIKYFRWEENVGVYENPNRMIQKISGDYFLFLNDDDWLDLNYVEECIKFFDKNKGYAFVTPSVILYDEDYEKIRTCFAPNLALEKAEDRIKILLAKYWISDIVTGVFSRDILTKMMNKDGYYFKKRVIEDVTFMSRALAVGKGKILTGVHYNKLNNGATRILEETPKDYYDIRGINSKNFPTFCINEITNIIMEDDIFSISIKDKQNYTKYLKKYLKSKWKLGFKYKFFRIFKFLKMYNKVFT